MSQPLEKLLAAGGVAVLDGALATELERRGADLKDPLWSAKCLIEQPEWIKAVHLDYFEAGADVATTATYQATLPGFAARGIPAGDAIRLMQSAVQLAKGARDEFWSKVRNRRARHRPLIAASIGPYGAMLADGSEYRGHYPIDDAALRDFHRPRLEALAASGADLFAFETLPCLREARVLAELLAEFPSMTAWLAFSCRNGAQTSEGENVGMCAAEFDGHPQIVAVGVNCTRPEYIEPLLLSMRARTGKPLVAYPNAGEAYDPVGKTWRRDGGNTSAGLTAPDFAQQALRWHAAGARLIGGCCRTSPADIAALRAGLSAP